VRRLTCARPRRFTFGRGPGAPAAGRLPEAGELRASCDSSEGEVVGGSAPPAAAGRPQHRLGRVEGGDSGSFGSAIVGFGSPFGSFRLPFGSFGSPFGSFRLPFGSFGSPFGSLGLPFGSFAPSFGSFGLPFGSFGLPFGSFGPPFGSSDSSIRREKLEYLDPPTTTYMRTLLPLESAPSRRSTLWPSTAREGRPRWRGGGGRRPGQPVHVSAPGRW
jgi:hypothetical protein